MRIGYWIGLLAAAATCASGSVAAQAAPDALRVTLCGTSGPLPVRDRAKPCVAVEAGGEFYLVDVGPESPENLQVWKLPEARAKAVFLTHLHSDHIGGLGQFNMQSWVAGRPAPLAVVGPSGVQDVAAGFDRAYGPDRLYRNAHHEHGEVRLPIAAGRLTSRVIDVGAAGTAPAWRAGALTVTAILVDHAPVKPALGYRFDYKGRSAVISGDTRKSANLALGAKGADVLIHEAQNADMTRLMAQTLKAQGNARTSSIMADTLSYHSTPAEAVETARAAGVHTLILTHLTQAGLPFFTPEAFLKGVDVGGLDLRLAKDGLTIDLPVGSTEVRISQR